jgi:hypothetical protein
LIKFEGFVLLLLVDTGVEGGDLLLFLFQFGSGEEVLLTVGDSSDTRLVALALLIND